MGELGRLAVWTALAGGTGSTACLLAGRARGPRPAGPDLVRLGHALLVAAVIAAGAATAILARALLAGDMSLTYVADFSRRDAGAPYRLAGLWGGMAGSLLLLAALVGAAGLLAARRAPDPRLRPVAEAVVAALVAAFAGLVLAFADPFRRLAVPAVDGGGLTPILEHPAMLYHPPLLYLGLAATTGPAALTAAALVEGGGRLDGRWAGAARRGLLVAWTLLALGMVAGAHWAYVEVGWGGYWGWDPVENTALLPWLAATLALHALRRADRSGPSGQIASDLRNSSADLTQFRPAPTLAGLACLPLLLALLGSLLTRSGATSSVHAFAESRAIGRALAVVVAVAALGLAVLLVRAARAGRPTGTAPAPGPAARDREADDPDPAARAAQTAPAPADGPEPGPVARLLGGHLAVVGAVLAVVLLGTVAPLAVDLRGGDGIAVEGRYFAAFAGPLAGAGLVLLALLPVARAAGRDRRRAVATAAAGAGLAVALVAAGGGHLDAPRLGLAAAAGAVAATGWRGPGRQDLGARVAHASLGLLFVGIAGTATGDTRTVTMEPDDTVTVLGRTLTYRGVTVYDGPVAGSSSVVAAVVTGGQTLEPSIVAFPDRAVLLPETSLVSNPRADVQVALRDARDDGSAVLRIGVHPLQVLVWWGALALTAGGTVAAAATRARDGRPGRSRRWARRREDRPPG